MKVDLSKVKTGDVFSENNHYVVKTVEDNGKIVLVHQETGSEISVDSSEVETRMMSADQYIKTVEITRNNRKSGEAGIKTIFESIPIGSVFTVTYQKKDQLKGKRALKAEKEARIQEVINKLQVAHDRKKSMSKKCIEEIKNLLENPITNVIPGEIRTLRGRKISSSTDGYYLCQDMDCISDKDSGERMVNVNTISELIYNGTKYSVK